MWLLNRLFAHHEQPAPRFAFQGTVNWMRAISILAGEQFEHDSLRRFYAGVSRRQSSESADTRAFEFLTMSMHNVCAVQKMAAIEAPYPIVRAAIISWYYAIYYSAKAMLAASSGSDPQTHALTAKVWQLEIVNNNLAESPFDLSLSDLRPVSVASLLKGIRGDNKFDLNSQPIDRSTAFGAACSYLKGTADYEQWRLEEQVKSGREYKQGGYRSFQSKAAKSLRDAKLQPAHVNFLVQAFRYRGKANYRDAIYLSYGRDESQRLGQFISDLSHVSACFSLMSAHFVARRVARDDWPRFVADIERYAKFALPFDLSGIGHAR
ncbi:TPA: hypothetical protein ACOEOK_004380 [Stenotrophomonas maltophilia]